MLHYCFFLVIIYYHTLKFTILLQYPNQCSQFRAHISKNSKLLLGCFFPLQPSECITFFSLPQLSFLVTHSLNLLALHFSPLWASNEQIPFFPLLPPDKGGERSQLLGDLLQTLLGSLFCSLLPKAETPFFSACHLLYLKSLSIPRKPTRVEELSRNFQRACLITKICLPFSPPNLFYSLSTKNSMRKIHSYLASLLTIYPSQTVTHWKEYI